MQKIIVQMIWWDPLKCLTMSKNYTMKIYYCLFLHLLWFPDKSKTEYVVSFKLKIAVCQMMYWGAKVPFILLNTTDALVIISLLTGQPIWAENGNWVNTGIHKFTTLFLKIIEFYIYVFHIIFLFEMKFLSFEFFHIRSNTNKPFSTKEAQIIRS